MRKRLLMRPAILAIPFGYELGCAHVWAAAPVPGVPVERAVCARCLRVWMSARN